MKSFIHYHKNKPIYFGLTENTEDDQKKKETKELALKSLFFHNYLYNQFMEYVSFLVKLEIGTALNKLITNERDVDLNNFMEIIEDIKFLGYSDNVFSDETKAAFLNAFGSNSKINLLMREKGAVDSANFLSNIANLYFSPESPKQDKEDYRDDISEVIFEIDSVVSEDNQFPIETNQQGFFQKNSRSLKVIGVGMLIGFIYIKGK